MADPPKGNIEQTITAVEGLVRAVPVYQDLVQPAAVETGQALKKVAKLIHVVLGPVTALTWGYERLEHFLENKVAPKLVDSPQYQLKCPPTDVVVPLLESVRLKADNTELVDLYAQLLASAMQDRDDRIPHPAFVEVLKQLSADDARVLRVLYLKSATPFLTVEERAAHDSVTVIDRCFTQLHEESGTDYRLRVVVVLDNLERLGLIELLHQSELPDASVYDDLESAARRVFQQKTAKEDKRFDRLRFQRGTILLREFGTAFCASCMEVSGGNRQISLKIVSSGPSGTGDDVFAVIVVPKIASLRRSGLTERLSEIRMRINGTIKPKDIITIKLYVNTNLTSRLLADAESEAGIYAGPSKLLIANGKQVGANSLVFTDIPLEPLAGLPASQRFFTIAGVRCNANQFGYGSLRGVEVFIEIQGIEAQSSPSHVVGQIIEDISVSVHGDALCTSANPPLFSLKHLLPSPSRHRNEVLSDANVFIKVSKLIEPAANIEGSIANGERVRLLFRFSNIPAGATIFSGLRNLSDTDEETGAFLIHSDSIGAGQLQLKEADSTFKVDGKSLLCASVSLDNGAGWTTYLLNLKSPSPTTLIVPIKIGFPAERSGAQVGLGRGSVAVSLAPLSTVTTASHSAPIARFADTSGALTLFQINL